MRQGVRKPHQFHVEHEIGAARNDGRIATSAVSLAPWYEETSNAADVHAAEADLPRIDDLLRALHERDGIAGNAGAAGVA